MPKKHQIYVRDMKNFDQKNFKLDYLGINWVGKLERYKDDANKAFLFFHWQMNHLLDRHMPVKKLSKKEYKRKIESGFHSKKS